MTRLARILIASTVLATLSAVSAAASDTGYTASASTATTTAEGGNTVVGTATTGESNILNGQITFGAQWSTINVHTGAVGGDVIVQGSAGANALDVTTFNDTHVTNYQESGSTNIGSSVNAEIMDVGGGVSISSQAFCNSADISTDPAITEVHSEQICRADDPGAEVNANVNGVGGDVQISANAFGNTYMEDTNALNSPATMHQVNTSNVFGTANTVVHNVAGSVAVTSSAIGNNAQIVHYTDTGAAVPSSGGQ
jgi:hypothetical protein